VASDMTGTSHFCALMLLMYNICGGHSVHVGIKDLIVATLKFYWLIGHI
jgi:hypothetical protein